MIFYAHRGNTNGPSMFENEPHYLTQAINQGFMVEVDVWCVKGDLWFGHEWPEHYVRQEWLQKYAMKCIFHCKNIEAVQAMQQAGYHFFWHQEDEYTITSAGYVWVYPSRPFPKSPLYIACEPDATDLPATWLDIHGICSDYVTELRRKEKVLCPIKK